MAGFFSGEYSFLFLLFLIMVITNIIAMRLDLLRDWRTAPTVMLLGGLTLYWLHPGLFV